MINYYLLTKPGIIMGNLITVAAGFLLASKGEIHLWLFLMTLVGIAFIMASACVFNNYIDRTIDKKMERTKNRPLVTGLISGHHAMMFATVLGGVGALTLFYYTNLLTVAVAGIGFFIYVILYSLWKRHTVYGTAIGSMAGAVPPVIGYCAVSNHFTAEAFILFMMMVLWQMPHFFSIAIYHLNDYIAAKIPVLPIERGIERTKIHMICYICCFLLVAMLLTFLGYTGYLYFIVTISVGLAWLILCLMGFHYKNDQVWGCHMFRLSLIMIMATCLVIPFDIRHLA